MPSDADQLLDLDDTVEAKRQALPSEPPYQQDRLFCL
jgi:hypothetical protein